MKCTATYQLIVEVSRNSWRTSPVCNSFTELSEKYGHWLDEHPASRFRIQVNRTYSDEGLVAEENKAE